MSTGLEKIFEIASQKLAGEQEAAVKEQDFQAFISTLREGIEKTIHPIPGRECDRVDLHKQGVYAAEGIAKSFASDKSDLSAQIFIGKDKKPIIKFIVDPCMVIYTQVVDTPSEEINLDPKNAITSEAFIIYPHKIEWWDLKNNEHHDLPVGFGAEAESIKDILGVFFSQNQV